MPNKLSDSKQRISSSQEKKLLSRVKAIAKEQGMSFTEALRLAMEKLVAEYENNKKTQKKE